MNHTTCNETQIHTAQPSRNQNGFSVE